VPEFEKKVKITQTGERNTTRSKVVRCFLREKPGTGKKGLASKYRYYVEELPSGKRVFLERPAWNKRGFDFIIHVEGEIFSNRKTNPAHKDIFKELSRKKQEGPREYKKLFRMIERVFQCEDPEDFIEECRSLCFESGLEAEVLLKVIKWFFIEQDIRYWNYSGRNMFMEGVRKI